MSASVLVIGSSNVDMIMKLPRLPQVGETITEGAFTQTFGGKGANQALAVARSGAKMAFVTCLGEDSFGPQMRAIYTEAGMDTRYVQAVPGPCGTALILIGERGRNYIAVAAGANGQLTPERLAALNIPWGDFQYVLFQYEIPVESLYYLLDACDGLPVQTVFNLAPAQAFDLAYLAKVDLLVTNETETAFVTGEALDLARPEAALPALRSRGIERGVITLGEAGCLVFAPEGHERLPAFPVEAVDTTAAGDTFCGYLVSGLDQGLSLAESARWASQAAALACTRMGAFPSVPWQNEVEYGV